VLVVLSRFTKLAETRQPPPTFLILLYLRHFKIQLFCSTRRVLPVPFSFPPHHALCLIGLRPGNVLGWSSFHPIPSPRFRSQPLPTLPPSYIAMSSFPLGRASFGLHKTLPKIPPASFPEARYPPLPTPGLSCTSHPHRLPLCQLQGTAF